MHFVSGIQTSPHSPLGYPDRRFQSPLCTTGRKPCRPAECSSSEDAAASYRSLVGNHWYSLSAPPPQAIKACLGLTSFRCEVSSCFEFAKPYIAHCIMYFSSGIQTSPHSPLGYPDRRFQSPLCTTGRRPCRPAECSSSEDAVCCHSRFRSCA